MGVEFLKIKEVDEAKEIINEKFNEYYTPQSEIIEKTAMVLMRKILKNLRSLTF